MNVDDGAITHLLRRFSGGDRSAADALVHQIYPELHRIAAQQLRRERFAAPVSPTELINEVWSRNLGKGGWQVKDRHHFYAIAARAMRQVLVDLARQRLSQSRGGGITFVSVACLTDDQMPQVATAEQLLRIDQLMDLLSEGHPVLARIVEMHYFAGLSLEAISGTTGLPLRRVRYLWDKGRGWLANHLA